MEPNKKINPDNLSRKKTIRYHMVCFILIYVLFALNRIKAFLSPRINGFSTTNEIWLILLIHIGIFLLNRKFKVEKNSVFLSIYAFIYLIIIMFGGFRSQDLTQLFYSATLFLVPMLLFYSTSRLTHFEIEKLIKIIVIINAIYSVFAIILTTNYAFFMNILGNSTENLVYYSQFRASMMLGSSITVSFYFNISLPLIFCYYHSSNSSFWRRVSILTIILNVMATLLLLSRLASIVAIIIVGYYILMDNKSVITLRKNIAVFIGFLIGSTYIINKYDISRVFMGFDKSGSSVSARIEALSLGTYIFSKYPFIGSGMGRYFTRVYENRFITVDDITGLVDPHNAFVLILSEIGILGLFITIFLFYSLFKRFLMIKNVQIRKASFMTLLVVLINSFGGSQVVNEISFSTIFWLYSGIFYFFSNNITSKLVIGCSYE
ncbi:O-antigen ligase family protein [Proteiniclasticum ruminis]|uniref:O-antigen ligase family protein n=1 Tax=Proteiniclasticum ruminis TaxID=398199 RepID=UPI0028A7CBC4|nr:O-antigen ligase family protein [Proteiniclasticum ruminis]